MSVSKQLEEILRQEEYGQKEYRNLYQKNPTAYDSPIRSWEEFRERFSTEITKEAPTPVKGFLSEKEIFTNEDVQVHCFKNVRFCPPFLHKLEFIKIVYIMEGTAVFYLSDKRYDMSEGNFCIVAPGVEQALFTADSNGIAVNILMRASTFTRTFSTLLYEQGILGDFFWKMAYTNYCNRVLFFSITVSLSSLDSVCLRCHTISSLKIPVKCSRIATADFLHNLFHTFICPTQQICRRLKANITKKLRKRISSFHLQFMSQRILSSIPP